MKIRMACLATLAVASAPAWSQTFTDEARVLDAREIREIIPLQREACWNERVRGYEDRRITRTDTGQSLGAGAVLGAIAGGVIGHQTGNSSGARDRATGAGAIIGGIIGHNLERNAPDGRRESTYIESVPTERNVERCRTYEETREAIVGYDVRYSYRGREFSTRLPENPGPTLRVEVDVRPLVEQPVERERPRSPSQPRY